jgi:penicillin-binding protein 1B
MGKTHSIGVEQSTRRKPVAFVQRSKINWCRAVPLLKYLIASSAVVTFVMIGAFFYCYSSYAKLVDERLARGYLTSRAGIYAAPRTLRVGQASTVQSLADHLRRAGYVESNASDVWSGAFNCLDDAIEIWPSRSQGGANPNLVRVEFNKRNRIDQLTADGLSLEHFTLEPEVLTSDAGMKSGIRTALGFNDLPGVLVQAILSTEDRRFFEHSGVDFTGILRAALHNAGDERLGQGASTVTQQLVKNTYLSPERTFKRKFAEAMLSFVLERRLSKQDIFALYCNEIYLGQRGGAGMRGVAQAARVYFGKEVKDLTLPEASLIAGMIKGPNRFSPDRHPEAAIARRSTVLGGMVRDGAITLDQAAAANKEPVNLAPVSVPGDSLAPYFVDFVNRNIDAALSGSGADEHGLRIFTTLDTQLQELAEVAVSKQLGRLDKVYKGNAPQAALVAIDPHTGDVLAMVGGRKYGESQLNRATDAMRQPGSVFKPIVYSSAIEAGLSPLSLFRDAPQEFRYDGRSVYRPANFGGGFSMQDVTMRTALIKSLNVVTVDVAMRSGLRKLSEMAEKFGLPRSEPYPALALGTTEVSPLAMASAYTVFTNDGNRVEPRIVSRAVDASGRGIVETSPKMNRVIEPATAFMITDMLSGVIDHGTAKSARGMVRQSAVAGKTGTSRDGWFIGYTPNLVVAVWIGFDDNKQLGLTGAEAALPAWSDFVGSVVAARPELGGAAFDRPEGVAFVDIDPETGLRSSEGCPQHERVGLKISWLPGLECYKHSLPVQPYVATIMPNDNPTATGAMESNLVKKRQIEASVVSTPVQSSAILIQATRTEKGRAGSHVLVNDLRVRN